MNATHETVSDPTLDPDNRAQIELARSFASQLVRGIKQIGLYRHNDARFAAFLAGAHEALADYTGRFGALSLKVEARNLLLLQQDLFADESPITWRFFRDGIRQIIFRPGVTAPELVTFTLIALSDERSGDVLGQLWKSQLEHVEYVAVEGFALDEESEQQVEVEVDSIVGYLYDRLRSDSDDFVRFSRLSASDLEANLEDVDQIRGAVVTGVTATDALKARLQREIEEEENQRLFPKLVSSIFEVVELGVDDPGPLEEMFVQLLDALLVQEDFATLNNILVKLRVLEERDGALSRLRSAFVARMGEEQRLGRVGEVLRTARPETARDLVRYLQQLEGTALLALLDILDAVEQHEIRQLLCDLLAPHARQTPEPFVDRLESDRPQSVRDMVYILEKSGHPERVKLVAPVMAHRNLAVRLEVLQALSKGKTAEARRLVAEALKDPAPQVRLLAVRLLPQFDRERAYVDLMNLIRDASFEKKGIEERTALYAALGATGVPGAVTHFKELLAIKPSLLGKKKALEEKLLAIAGLGGEPTLQTYKVLQAVVEDKTHPAEVLMAARKAMYLTKKALFGEAGEA